jgi:hypothetical protein
MLRVGIIAEGETDFLVLEEIMKTITAELEFVHIHPAPAVDSGFGRGWRGVKAWCEENGPEIETYLSGVPSRALNLIVTHADCSMADKAKVAQPCPPASDTAVALAKVIETEWLGRNPKPDFVVIATPSQSIEAWVVAAFDPPYANLADIECDRAAEDELIKRRILKKKSNGQPRKQVHKYAPLAGKMVNVIDSVCSLCPQAEAFRSNFQAAVARTSPPSAT